MAYVVKVGPDQLAAGQEIVIPQRGSAKSIRNGEKLFVFVDYSVPGADDGGLAARGTIVEHRYEQSQIALVVQLDGRNVVHPIFTSSLDGHKGSPDPVWGRIAEVRRNTNHRIFDLETPEAADFLDSCFLRM